MLYLRTSVGIEIRQGDLIISCLQSNLSTGVFTHFARISDYQSRPRTDVRAEIDRFFKSHRLNRDNLVLGIERKDLIVRHLELPVEVLDNLKQVVQYQVQSFEPTEEDKYCYDYALVKPNQGAKRLLVLVVMVRKSTLDGYLKLLDELGLRPATVIGSTIGLSNIFLYTCGQENQKTFMLADVTKDGIEIIALRDGALVYTQTCPVTADQSAKDALVCEAEQAAGKIRLAPDEVIEKIVLNGDACASIHQELDEIIEDSELIGNRIRFEMAPEVRPRLQEAVTSLGLAYSGMVRRPALKLNLLPGELRSRQTRWAYIPAIVFGAASLIILCGFGVRPIIQNRVLLTKLDREIAALKPQVERVQNLRSQADQLEKRVISFETLLRNRDMNLEILQELTNIFPPDTFMQNYQYQEGSLTLMGASPSAEALIPKLEASPLLKEVQQRGQVYRDQGLGKDRFTFAAKLER